MVFYSVSSNIDEILSSIHLLMCLSLETLMSIIRTGYTILVDMVNSNDLTHMVNFPTRIHDCDSHSPVLLDFVLSSDANISFIL